MKRARQFLALEPLDDEVNQCQPRPGLTGVIRMPLACSGGSKTWPARLVGNAFAP